jgi:hypothetical protein
MAFYTSKMFGQRRATVFFMPLLFVVVLISLIMMYHVLNEKHDNMEKKIGKEQGAILASEKRAEKALFYIDKSVEYSADSSAYKLAESGGYYYTPSCGTHLGSAVWNKNENNQFSEDCFPLEAEQNFEEFFNAEFKERIIVYPDIDLSGIDYTVLTQGNMVYGFASQPLYVDILLNPPEVDQSKIADLQKAAAQARLEKIQKALHESGKAAGTGTSVAEQLAQGKYAWPSGTGNLVVTSCFGWRNIDYGSTDHQGIDIKAGIGDPVLAVADGTVKQGGGGAYNTVDIAHDNSIESLYLHNSEVFVKKGDKVKKGQVIALAGKAGAKYAHIHFTLKKNNQNIDPLDPANSIFQLTGIEFQSASNCKYACTQYAYCSVIKESVIG